MKKNLKKKNKNYKLTTYSIFAFFILVVFLSIIILFFGIIKFPSNTETEDNTNVTYYDEIEIENNTNLENKTDKIENDNKDEIYKNKNSISILVSPQEKKEEKRKKSICIIIDDYGYQDTSSILLNLPFKISVSILPGLPFSKSGFALFSNSKNITPMLHIPMESINQFAQAEKNEIKTSDNESEITKKLDLFFQEIPAMFANNHMGSKVSLSENTIKIILNYLRQKGVRFVDSHTINNSLFVPIGKSIGYPIFENNLFLDYNDDEKLPEKEFYKALSILKTRDFIIIIGHNTKKQTIEFLIKLANSNLINQYDFITVRELFEKY